MRLLPGHILLSTACILLLAAVLSGCSRLPQQITAPPPRVYRLEPATLRAIDAEILAASRFARQEAGVFSRISMDEWRARVRQRIEQVFIPWYSDYWTQQWLAAKVAWYKLDNSAGEPAPEDRLVDYLQEQFYYQVLEPVSEFVDPHDVMDETTGRYLHELAYRLDPLPVQHAIAVEAFNQHLEAIPAIVTQAKPRQEASLLEVLQANNLSALPAYTTLKGELPAVNDNTGQGAAADKLHTVARSAVTRLVNSLAVRGGATAASTLVGGIWGVMITVGAGFWGVVEYEQVRPVIEAQLQENLDVAVEVMWQELVEDTASGVAAVVHHISSQLESAPGQPPNSPPPPAIPTPGRLL